MAKVVSSGMMRKVNRPATHGSNYNIGMSNDDKEIKRAAEYSEDYTRKVRQYFCFKSQFYI